MGRLLMCLFIVESVALGPYLLPKRLLAAQVVSEKERIALQII